MTETLQTPAEEALAGAELGPFEAGLRGELIRPGDPGYEEARQVFNGMVDKRPALIVRCAGGADVISAVRFARESGLLVAVRGGGHNVAGSAVCGGIVIDLSQMKGVWIDPATGTARVEPGVTWGEFNHDLQAFDLGATGGYISTTGVPGLTLGGGLGWLMSKHGLACDNLRSADVVTADGRFLRASESENADLFWGLRGGGGNFGIVTSFEFGVHPVGTVLAGLLVYPLAAAGELLTFFRAYAQIAPDELTSGVLLLTAPRVPFVPEPAQGMPVCAVTLLYAGPPAEGERVLRPLREFRPPLVDLVQPMPYAAAQCMADDFFPAGLRHYWKSSYLRSLGDDAINTLVTRFETVPAANDHDRRATRRRGRPHRPGRDRLPATLSNLQLPRHLDVDRPRRRRAEHRLDARARRRDGALHERRRIRELPRRRRPGARQISVRNRAVRATRRAQEPVRPDQLLPPQPEHQARPMKSSIRARNRLRIPFKQGGTR